MFRLVTCGVVLSFVTCSCHFGFGGEVLVNGSLEASASPIGWTLNNSITGQPGLNVNVTEHIGGNADEFGDGLGLFIRPFAGNVGDYTGENFAVNTVLSQVVNITANRKYTFTGSARWVGDGDPETNDGFSGGVDFLLPGSPSDPDFTGTVPSPTRTYFQMEFLDQADTLIGDPVRVDLKEDGQLNDNFWSDHSVMGMAPANARKVRVTAAALDMVDNFSAQEAYFDTFTLRDDASPNTERLQNANLNAIGAPAGFDVAEMRDGVDTLIGFRDFANHTTGGQQGFWLRAFAGGDGEISQLVDATPGGTYEFSAWSKWETGYSGGIDETTVTSIDMQFLDTSNNVLSVETLDLRETDQANDGIWRQYSLSGTAPANTDKVRVRVGATGMYNTGVNPQSAFFDDLSLIETLVSVNGDYNNDGLVDAADIDLQAVAMKTPDQNLATFDENRDGTINQADRQIWVKTHAFGNQGTWVGDADLNGEFNSTDFITTFLAGKYESGEMAGWAEGDWDGNMMFDSGDFIAAFLDGGYELGPLPAVNAVPEPSSLLLTLCAVLGLIGVVRRR